MINRLCVCALIEYRIPLQATAMGNENWNGKLLVMESCREMCKVEHSLFVIVPGGSFLIVCLIELPLSLFGEFFHLIYQIFLSAMNFSSSSSSFFKEKLQILSLCPSILIVILKQFKPYLHLI